MARMAPMTAAPPAMSSFMRSMPSAGLIEMPPVSNVMPLPTRPSTGRAGAPGGVVPHDEHPRRLGAAAGDAEQEAHLQADDVVFVQDLDVQSGVARDGAAALGEDRRRQHVGRLVAEIAGNVAGLAEDRVRARRRPGAPVARLAGDDHGFLERRRGTIAALVAIAAEAREQQPFCDRLHGSRVAAAPRQERDTAHPALPGGERRGGRDLAQALGVEVGGLAGADQRDAAARHGAPSGVRNNS